MGLVWPAVGGAATSAAAAPGKGEGGGSEGAAEGPTADPSALTELFALLSQQPCDAVAIDALDLLLDVSRARAAHGQPPLKQLQQPLLALQGRLRTALSEAAAAVAAAAAKETEQGGMTEAAEAGGAGGAGKGGGKMRSSAGPGGAIDKQTAAEVEAEKVKVRAGLALRAVKELLLLVGGGVRKSD